MAVANIQKIARFEDQDGNRAGKNYRGNLDTLKQGKVPIPLEFYNRTIPGIVRDVLAYANAVPDMSGPCRLQGVSFPEISKECEKRYEIAREFLAYLPAASDIHGSYAPQGVSFSEAGKKYGKRYEGYHVSEGPISGEKILFPLPKKLPDAQGNEVNVLEARDRIILLNLDVADGPSVDYEHNAKKNETLLHLNGKLTCVPFPASNGWIEMKNGSFEKSDDSNPNAIYLWRANGASWNGIFLLGFDAGYDHFRSLLANRGPSYLSGVLARDPGATAEQVDPARNDGGFDALRPAPERLIRLPSE